MNNEEVIELLRRIEDKINDNVRLNQDIRTVLFIILATFIIFAFYILANFIDPTYTLIVLLVPSVIGIYKIIRRIFK